MRQVGIYTEAIRKKEENNIRLERYGDESLADDKKIFRLEDEVEDAQSAVLHIFEKFGIRLNRIYGMITIPSMLETLLDPLGLMYDYEESVDKHVSKKTEYIMAFREDGKAVTFYPSLFGYRYYCPHDSSTGFVSASFVKSLQKGCYIFNRPLEGKKHTLTTFIYNVLKCLTFYDIVALVFATGLVSGLGLVIPRISRWVYKEYVDSGGAVDGFRLVIVSFILVALIRTLISMIKSLFLTRVKIRVSMKMQSSIMARVLHLPQRFFTDNSSGRLSKRISNCSRLSDQILNIIMDVLLDFSFSFVYLFQMKSFAPALFLPGLLFLVLKILASIISSISYSANETRLMEADMDSTSLLYSSIRGIQKIKGMGAEKAIYARWTDMYRRILSATYNQPVFLKYNAEIISFLSIGATVALLGVSMLKGVSAEDYMAFSASYALVITVVSSLTDMMQNIFLLKTLCQNVSPILKAKTEQEQGLEYVNKLNGHIRAENICFSYEGDSGGCLKGVTVDIKMQEKVAVVGESGCGKSTFLKILLGMETPDAGTVYYDNKPIQDLNMRSLRRKIGSVFQFSRVFPGTIASNVAFGAGGQAAEEDIWDAVDKAAIGDYIRSLPLKLDTEISESNSSGFSGGQRQRILIARALLGKPHVLILDEATSALDNVTQKKVLENIGRLNCTVVMVAHRLSTVIGFDRIIMFEDGVIAEEGSYEELMEKNGKFAELVRKQLVEQSAGQAAAAKK